MKLRETIHILAPPEKVWKLIAEPSFWLSWNPKLVHLRRGRTGPVVEGEQFSSKWKLKRREEENELFVREVLPMQLLHIQQHYTYKNRTRSIEVKFEMHQVPRGVKVVQTIDHSQAGIPLPLRMLMWAIFRFGKPTTMSNLERLKSLAETPAEAST